MDELLFNKQIAFGSALKALDEQGRMGGYLVIWGSRDATDLQGEYFTKESDLGLDWFEGKRPLLYHHLLDSKLKVPIGFIDTFKVDDEGLWIEAQLDMRKQYVSRVWQLVKEGALGLSSGSMPHWVEIEPDGRIKKWPIVEGSATPTPAEPRTRVMALKALVDGASLLEESPHEETKEVEAEAPAEGNATGVKTDVETTSDGVEDMNPQMITALIDAFVQALGAEGVNLSDEQRARLTEQLTAHAQSMTVGDATAVQTFMEDEDENKAAPAAVVATMKALRGFATDLLKPPAPKAGLLAAAKSAMGEPQSRVNGYANGTLSEGAKGGQITDMKDLRYDYLSPQDLIFGIQMRPHMRFSGGEAVPPPSESMLKAAALKLAKVMDTAPAEKMRPAFKSFLKADEIYATNLTNAGQQWVGVAYEDFVWERIRMAVVYQQVKAKGMLEIDMPQGINSVYIPSEGSDPTVYSLVELNDIESDERPPVTAKTSTGTMPRRQLTAGFVGVRQLFSDIQDEDSLIAMLPWLRQQNDRVMQEAIESIILNGDTVTTANTNINLIDGTPSVDSKGRGPSYLAMDGILKLALVTTTSLSRDAGSTLDEEDYLNTLALLPAAERQDRSRLLYVVDSDVSLASAKIPAFKTRDVYIKPTLEVGVLMQPYNIDLVESGQLVKANTAGKISGTGGNNTKGRIVIIRPDQWGMGFKRQIRTESDRDIDAQATVVVSTLRFGIQYRSATGGVGVSYNVAV